MISGTKRNVRLVKCETQQKIHLLSPAGASNCKAAAAMIRRAPDILALNVWRSGPVFHIYKLSWYITKKKKKKLGRKQPFQPVKKPLESIPLPRCQSSACPTQQHYQEPSHYQQALGLFVPSLSRTCGNTSLTEDKEFFFPLSLSPPSTSSSYQKVPLIFFQ